ncbi:MAG: SPFH domain-containing protein, partial [Planctomycetes bacterium]|nr:SPFH domain-containing protein [Planctomycetota bacterium]
MLALNIGLTAAGVALFVWSLVNASAYPRHGPVGFPLTVGVVLVVLACISYAGHFTLQPNEGRVLVLFGAYGGTVRESGFHWTHPFNSKLRVSLRARNMNTERLKVNDLRGNPIEIGAVVVWRVQDTAQALFDVDHYEDYVKIQSESALR